jgi:signal transduction histidine kinase/HAMP domain-containing protein
MTSKLIQNLKSKTCGEWSRSIQNFRLLTILQAFRRRRRGRLVRHYFLISLLLIAGGLISSAALEIYFRYRESQEQIALFEQQAAAVAALKIERFVQEIVTAIKSSTKSREVMQSRVSPEYKFELKRLLYLAPAITEAVAVDIDGVKQAHVSRAGAVSQDAKSDFTSSPGFQRALKGQPDYGPVYFVQNSEPYMTIAFPIEQYAGTVIGVIQAEVNLKHVWDVVSNIKTGEAGYAYVVTRSGDLIAHRDISLVLRRQNLAHLPQVKGAFEAASGAPRPRVTLASNLEGKKVISSNAFIPSLQWLVIIERPAEEAYTPLYASMLRTSALLLVGFSMAVLASLFVGRRVVRPLEALRRGVERIGKGDLNHSLHLKTGDEIEILADEFNEMATHLREAYTGLERKVAERTRELRETLEQQVAITEVLRVMASRPTDTKALLETILERALQLCQTPHGSIFTFDGEAFHLSLIKKPVSAKTLTFLETPIRPGPETPLRRIALDLQPIHSPDILTDPRFSPPSIYRNEGIRTTIAMPLLKEGKLLGAIAINRREVQPFNEREIEALTAFANQAVIALENARLFEQLQIRSRDLAEKGEQLEIANRHKSQFLANVNHELRTPVSAIIGYARLVMRATEGQISRLQRENLQDLLNNAERLLNQIDSLLEFSKIEAGKMEVQVEPVGVSEVIQEAIATIESTLNGGSVRIIREIDSAIPVLNTDREKLRQIVLNLLDNAVKFTERAEIKIAASQQNGSVTLAVSDSGIGIPKEELNKIFEEFQRGDAFGTKNYRGTGLGLAIVKQFVNLLGGEIAVESEVGKGSVFTVTLPFDREDGAK